MFKKTVLLGIKNVKLINCMTLCFLNRRGKVDKNKRLILRYGIKAETG